MIATAEAEMKAKTATLLNRYNPEHDLIADPRTHDGFLWVTWGESELAEAVIALAKIVDEQAKRIDELETVLRRNLPA